MRAGDKPVDMEEWMRDVERRIARLEQRLAALGSTVGTGTGVDNEAGGD